MEMPFILFVCLVVFSEHQIMESSDTVWLIVMVRLVTYCVYLRGRQLQLEQLLTGILMSLSHLKTNIMRKKVKKLEKRASINPCKRQKTTFVFSILDCN